FVFPIFEFKTNSVSYEHSISMPPLSWISGIPSSLHRWSNKTLAFSTPMTPTLIVFRELLARNLEPFDSMPAGLLQGRIRWQSSRRTSVGADLSCPSPMYRPVCKDDLVPQG